MKRKSREEMFPIIAAWESSKANQEEFCLTQDLSLSTFTYWRGKYRKAQQGSNDSFTELQPEVANSIEVLFPNGVKVNLPKHSSLSTIEALIRLG